MKITIPSPSDRVISCVVLLQSATIVGGTLFVTAMLKIGRSMEDLHTGENLPWRAVFVHHYGFTFLLLPILWAGLTWLVARSQLSLWYHRSIISLGILIIPFATLYYLGVGFDAMWVDVRPSRGLHLFPQ